MPYPRREVLSALLAVCVCLPQPSAFAKSPAGAPVSSTWPGPVQRLEIGPERIVCGMTAPAAPSPQARPGKHRPGLVVWFHGGMRSPNREKGLEAHRPLVQIVDPRAFYLCSPSAFAGRDWLSPGALATTEALIDSLLAAFPIDSGDVNLMGVSDGCLAVIRYSMAGRRRINRRVLVSSYPELVLSPESLRGQRRFAEGRWDFLQGGRDRLFPIQSVLPFLRDWEARFPNARVHYFPEGEHDYGYYATYAPELLRGFFRKNLKKTLAPTVK